MKQVQIPVKQTPKDYLVVRVWLVHVKLSWWRRLLGLTDKQLTASAFVAKSPQEAVDETNSIVSAFQKKKGYNGKELAWRSWQGESSP